MKNYKYLLLVSTCLLFNNNSQASELDLTFNSSSLPLGINTTLHTHTPNVGLKPISNFVKLAAVCSVTGEGCQGLGFGSNNNDIDLGDAALCQDEGYGTSCPSGYVPDTSQKCPYNNSFYKCRPCSHSCSSGSLAYCNSNQLESGSFRNDCGETCYTCRTKTCADGGYSSSINSCQKASSINYAGNTCYTSVVSKTCADGGYSASISANQVGQSISYCGKTCYSGVKNPTCSEGGFKLSIPTNQSCTSTTYYGQTCYKDCYTPNCGAGGYNASIPANNICSSINYYGTTCYKDCYQPACSSGGFVNSCPTGQTGTAVAHYGRTCYKNCALPACSETCSGVASCGANEVQVASCTMKCGSGTKYTCRAKTCADGGYVNSCPTGQTGTSVSHYGRTCYKDCKNTDIICSIGTVLYEDKKCYADGKTTKTPIGVVFDEMKRKAVSLKFGDASWGPNQDIIRLNNCTYSEDADAYEYCDHNGKINTTIILEFGQANGLSYPAAEYCYNYTTVGTNKGDWYLPSMFELATLSENFKLIQDVVIKLGGKLGDYRYHSSNEINASKKGAYYTPWQRIDKDYEGKNTTLNVQPIMQF